MIKKSKFLVYVFGIRGFPGIIGGAEKHCESLYPHIANLGYDIRIIQRTPYVKQNHKKTYKNVRLINLWTVKNKYFEVILHSFLASFKCITDRPDIIHIHNIGPCVVLPFLKFFNRNIIVTYHRSNYLDDKWGIFASFILKTGEFFAKRFAMYIIYISKQFEDILPPNKSCFLPNGVETAKFSVNTNFLNKIGVTPDKFILFSGRIVPEKAVDLLIKTFSALNTDFKLVIAGSSNHDSDYEKKIQAMASKDKRIILTGFITGDFLNQLYTNAGLFVLPSFHEGLSISLLEAMSFDVPVLVSDIKANHGFNLEKENLFKCGDPADLSNKMKNFLIKTVVKKTDFKTLIGQKHNWEKIAEQTVKIYEKTLEK